MVDSIRRPAHSRSDEMALTVDPVRSRELCLLCVPVAPATRMQRRVSCAEAGGGHSSRPGPSGGKAGNVTGPAGA